MSRIAYVCIPAPGHILPSLALVHELQCRGHDLAYFTSPCCEYLIKPTQVRCIPYHSTILSERPRKLDGFRGGKVPSIAAAEICYSLPSLLRSLEEFSPDLICHDGFTFAGILAAEILGVPTIRCEASHLPSRHYSYFRACECGELEGEITSRQSLEEFDQLLQPVFDRYGLSPRGFHELAESEPELTIAYMAKFIHPAGEAFDSNRVKFIGPSINFELCVNESNVNLSHFGSRPLIYVALGSIFHYEPAFYLMAIEALGSQDADVILVAGPIVDLRILAARPANIQVVRYAPQLHILNSATLFINHGGMGSVMESLYFGVPMLMVPQFPEHLLTARQVEKIGAGRCLERDEVSINRLRQYIGALLTDTQIRSNVAEWQTETKAAGGYKCGCEYIESFARSVARHTPIK